MNAQLCTASPAAVRTAGRATRRGLQLTLLLLLLQGAAGCGPGVGGTGTGDSVLASFGATAAPVCASGLAARLACPTTSQPGSGAAAPATGLVFFAAGVGASQAVARIEGNRIDLDAPCQRIRFSGEWGSLAGQTDRFYGSLTTDAAERPVLATLSVQSDGDGLVLLLQDTEGRVRFGPRLLLSVLAPPAPGACS